MKPCYVFGPWIDRPSNDPIAAVREAPNPSERAEVWLYTKEDDGTPVSEDVAGWYGCFGAMTDSVRLGPSSPAMTINGAMASLDQMIREAGHLFAEDVERMREMARVASSVPVFTVAQSTPTRRATDTDSPIGDDRAPDRYMASGRETIDEVRDACHALTGDDEDAADALFAAHCLLTAYVYQSRAGRKGDAASDHAKARWYLTMACYAVGLNHAINDVPYTDPRANRPTYTPYQRSPHALRDVDWGDFPIRDLLGAILLAL